MGFVAHVSALFIYNVVVSRRGSAREWEWQPFAFRSENEQKHRFAQQATQATKNRSGGRRGEDQDGAFATGTSRTINRSASLKEGLKVNMELQPRKKRQRQQTRREHVDESDEWRSRKRRDSSCGSSITTEAPQAHRQASRRGHVSIGTSGSISACTRRTASQETARAPEPRKLCASFQGAACTFSADPGKQRKFTRHVFKRLQGSDQGYALAGAIAPVRVLKSHAVADDLVKRLQRRSERWREALQRRQSVMHKLSKAARIQGVRPKVFIPDGFARNPRKTLRRRR